MRSILFKTLPLLVVLLGLWIGDSASKCGIYNTCALADIFYGFVFSFFDPLYIFCLFSLPAVLFLPFVKKKVFSVWTRFAICWVVLSGLLVLAAPEQMNAWFYIVSYAKEDVARLMGALFSLISLILLPISTLALYSRSKGYS